MLVSFHKKADARVIWDYMAAKGGATADLIHSPEEEEASALETLGTAGIAAMGPQVRGVRGA